MEKELQSTKMSPSKSLRGISTYASRIALNKCKLFTLHEKVGWEWTSLRCAFGFSEFSRAKRNQTMLVDSTWGSMKQPYNLFIDGSSSTLFVATILDTCS